MPHRIRTSPARALATATLALLLTGCQATLFGVVNAGTRDAGVVSHRNIVFDATHHLALDVYSPAHARQAPVVVFFYGGSWMSGKRQWYRWVGETLARHGIVTVVPDYRKYPRVRMAGFMRDAARAVAWAHANAPKFGGDPRQLFLMGHSAGAHIGALLATDGHWLRTVDLKPRDLAGFIGLAGPYDFLPLTDPRFIDLFGHDAAGQAASQPVNFVDGDEPPMLLLQGTGDHTVAPKNARSLAAALKRQRETVRLKLYPGVGHIGLLLSLWRPRQGKTPALTDSLRFIGGPDRHAGAAAAGPR